MYKKIKYTFLLCLIIFSSTLSSADTDYRVGGDDIIKITVYDNPDLETRARVGSEGNIIFPLIGKVNVAGKTVTEISQIISKMLSDGYIVDPQVSVFIEQYRSKKVVIVGQVRKPGLYELSGPTTIMELISKAEGLEKDAGNKIIVKRVSKKDNSSDSSEEVRTVDLKKLMTEGAVAGVDISLLDGDTVYVPKAYTFYITGEVKKPNSYVYEEGLTLIKAISMAGGFTDVASKNKIKIVRNNNGQDEVINNVSIYEKILPDDVIVVPESFF